MSKHTPGPWRVEIGTTVIWTDNAYDPGTNNVGCIVARAAQPYSWKGSRPTADEQIANAHLIAAAPDMLAALKRLSGLYDGIYVKISDDEMAACREAWAEADTAIAKAEGGS